MELSFDVYLPPGDLEKNLPPVILLHGILDSKKTWKFTAPDIAKNTGRKVYAVDARNHGDSPWEDYFTFDILATDLDNFLVQHNIPRATLIGHSMGGRAALTLALLKPEKVEKLVIEDIDLRNFKPSAISVVMSFQVLLREALNVIPAGSDETQAKQAVIDFATPFILNELHPRYENYKYDMSMVPLVCRNGVYSWKANVDAIEKFLTTNRIRQSLSGIYLGDTLFLYGTKTFFKVATDPLIMKYFPQSVKIKFEGATHFIHNEYPERFITEVSNFINGYRDVVKSKY